MPPVGGSVVGTQSAAERVTANTATKLEALRGRMPSTSNKSEKVEAKYDVVLECESDLGAQGRMGSGAGASA